MSGRINSFLKKGCTRCQVFRRRRTSTAGACRSGQYNR
ncbi:hypothetical protein D1BOALGB6SA_6001 [Olavius sp. associated proteobacterium Delta 1]|nr:hypothetical protein D1BOALGB6SA_6001 [Olavius sp. associated proteobacterium Delta 1]